MKPLRISAISYLNTGPLMWDFEHGLAEGDFDIAYTLPSRCAAALAAGDADIGIIPAAAYTSIADLVILPGVAIASRRAVRSILLVSKVPVQQIRNVALDSSSLTSVALTKLLFARHWQTDPIFTSMDPDLELMLGQCDAGLLIGDPALTVDRSQYFTYDLAEEWVLWTGKPFVFAFWAVRQAALENLRPGTDLAATFQRSRDRGLTPESVGEIARRWGPRLGLTTGAVRQYLTENIHYYLGSECLEGLQLFYTLSHACGALGAAPPLRFAETAKPALNKTPSVPVPL
jgi:chorismate dehydratase